MPRLPDGVWHRRCLTPVALWVTRRASGSAAGVGSRRVPDPAQPIQAPPF